MSDDAGEDEDAEEGQRHEEEVKIAVVPLAHAVTKPGAMVVKTLCKPKAIT